ncbi:unnamed protein product [Ectocarpus fasciculatus]
MRTNSGISGVDRYCNKHFMTRSTLSSKNDVSLPFPPSRCLSGCPRTRTNRKRQAEACACFPRRACARPHEARRRPWLVTKTSKRQVNKRSAAVGTLFLTRTCPPCPAKRGALRSMALYKTRVLGLLEVNCQSKETHLQCLRGADPGVGGCYPSVGNKCEVLYRYFTRCCR